MDKLPSHGQALAGGARHSRSSLGGDGGDPGDRQSSSPGQAWGRTVNLPDGSATSHSTVPPASINRQSVASSQSTSSTSSTDSRDTKTGPRVLPVPDAVDPQTRWLARALGTSWTRAAIDACPRAAEADLCKTTEAAAKWVASVMDDARVSVDDAGVCAVLLMRERCSHILSPDTVALIDAIVTASLGEPVQARLDKAAAMLAGLCRSMEAMWTRRDSAANVDGLPPAHWRIQLATRLLAPGLPPGDLARHVREEHAERLMQALARRLCPPRAEEDAKAVAFLPSTQAMFRDHPTDLGLLLLARGLAARVRRETREASEASGMGPSGAARAEGLAGGARSVRWPRPLAQGVALVPLAPAQGPRRLATQAMLVNAIHRAVNSDDEAQSLAVIAALNERIVREGRTAPVSLLMAGACGVASAVWRLERNDAEDNDRDPNFETVMEDELETFLDVPGASALSRAGYDAVLNGFALAQDPVDWVYRRSQDGKGFGLDTQEAIELADVALEMRGSVEKNVLLAELASDCLLQSSPQAAIAAVGSLLRHAMEDIDHLALIAAGRQMSQHLGNLARKAARLAARLLQVDGKDDRATVSARRDAVLREFDEARLQWIPAVYRGFAQSMHERWGDMGPHTPPGDLRDFVDDMTEVCATLRGQAKVWRDESRVNLQGRADHLCDLLEKLARELDALVAQARRRLGEEVTVGGGGDAPMEARVAAVLAPFQRAVDGKDTTDAKDGKGSPRDLGADDVQVAVRQLGALWSSLREGAGGEADLAGTLFLSTVGRQLAALATHPRGRDLIASSTSHLVAEAGLMWQGVFLRELMTGSPQAQQHAFSSVVHGLHHAHKGLKDPDWGLLLDHLLEARLPDDAAQGMGMMLVFNAAACSRDKVLPAMTQMVRQLALRPGTVTAQARLARLVFEALREQAARPASAANPLGGLDVSPRPVLDDQALAMVGAPRAVARLVAVLALALRDFPGGASLAQHWVFDAVGAVDAALVAAQLDAFGPKAQERVAKEGQRVLECVQAMGGGLAFALASGRHWPDPAEQVRSLLTLPAKAGVQAEVQEALWRGMKEALAMVAAGQDVGGPSDAASAKPGGHEGSKSRRTGTGRDREDPPDAGYSGKRKEARKPGQSPGSAQGTGSPGAAGVPVPPTVAPDPQAQQAQQLREGFTQALESFAVALSDPSLRLPLSAPRKALERWLRVPYLGEPSAHAFAGTGRARAESRHPADAAGIGVQLEQVFRGFAYFVEGQVLRWYQAGHDPRALAERVGREMAQWEALNSPHARPVVKMLARALEVLEHASTEGGRPRAPEVALVVSRETQVASESKSDGDGKSGTRTPPTVPRSDDTGALVMNEAGDWMDADDDVALAMSMSLRPLADLPGGPGPAPNRDSPGWSADPGDSLGWDTPGGASGLADWDDPMDPRDF